MYRIIGADGKEYGPISTGELRQWLKEGRVNSQTRIHQHSRTRIVVGFADGSVRQLRREELDSLRWAP